MESTVTRRNFVKGAALGTVAAAGITGVAHADELPQQWDQEADFVVIGAGATGIAGAIEAIDLGMSALVLEKMPKEIAGGDTRCNAGLMYMMAADPDFTEVTSFGKLDEDYRYDIADEAEVSVEWLMDHGCVWQTGENASADCFEGHGPAVYAALESGLEESGVPVLYETRATRLIVDHATGEIAGVYAEQGDAQIAVKANKGVLIATGSYVCNEDLIYEFNHFPGLDYVTAGAPYLTGDGLIMGLAVGASLFRMVEPLERCTMCATVASEEIGSGIFAENPPRMSMFWINGTGRRFMDETLSLAHNKNNTNPVIEYDGGSTGFAGFDGYTNKTVWRIFDQACFDSGSQGNAISEFSWARLMDYKGYVWSDDNKAELDRGWIVQADTIEELAEKIGVPADVLAETVEKYNAGCESGQDEFGRGGNAQAEWNPTGDGDTETSTLLPLGDGPFYAMQLSYCLIYSIGGLKHDENSCTINWYGEVIPRLYNGGDVGMGTYLLPMGIPTCMAQGRLAARHASTLEARA